MDTRYQPFEQFAGQLPLGRDPASVSRRLDAVEFVLERMLVVPGLNRRLGLDSIIGLVPVVGDVVTALFGIWLVWEARNLGMSRFQLARMTMNVGVDTAIGAIPFVGDLFDFAFRSNTRNLRIVKRWLAKNHPHLRTIEGEVIAAPRG